LPKLVVGRGELPDASDLSDQDLGQVPEGPQLGVEFGIVAKWDSGLKTAADPNVQDLRSGRRGYCDEWFPTVPPPDPLGDNAVTLAKGDGLELPPLLRWQRIDEGDRFPVDDLEMKPNYRRLIEKFGSEILIELDNWRPFVPDLCKKDLCYPAHEASLNERSIVPCCGDLNGANKIRSFWHVLRTLLFTQAASLN
jgi:hypothetical protein